MENLMSVVRQLASKTFNINVITKNENGNMLSNEIKQITYIELGTYLLTHNISLIEITEIIDT